MLYSNLLVCIQKMSSILIAKLDSLIEGEVIKRPSRHIKTPYVADVLTNNNGELICHSVSLGCCGLADAGSTVLMVEVDKSKQNKCSHSIYLSVIKDSEHDDIIVGIHPKMAETLGENAWNQNLLTKLQNVKRYRRETTIHVKDEINSRFDFTGVDENGIPFIMEVKNVPLADYEDVSSKDRKKMDFSGRDINSKVAYFPDGYRKKAVDTVSPRALKHITELTKIKKQSNVRCIMCYVIQRNDVNRFQPSIIDPEYRSAFKMAIESGVEIITMVVSWNRNGEATFVRDDLPIGDVL